MSSSSSCPLVLLFLLLSCCCCWTSISADGRQPFLVGLLLPASYRRRVEPWLALSLRHMDQLSANSTSTSTPFLPNYCLQLAPKDTGCRMREGMKAVFDLMDPAGGGKVLALFGDICTDVNEPVAMAMGNWNVVHLSFTETHAKFGTADSKELYPTFFRLVPGERNLNRARTELIQAFGWRRVGGIKQSDHSSLALAHERLTTRLEQAGVQVVFTASLSSESGQRAIGAELEELKARDVHIIVADLSLALTLRVLCSAFQHGLFGPDIVWILPGFQSSPEDGSVRHSWWREADQGTNCSQAQLARVLEGHFALDHSLMRPFDENLALVGGQSVRKVLRDYRQLCSERDSVCEPATALAHSAYAYDGLWTLGLALNRSLTAAANGDIDRGRLLAAMRQTDFQGLSGRVRFDEGGERLGLVQVLQWTNGSYSVLGYMDCAQEQFHLRRSNQWSPPPDSTLVLRRREYVRVPLLVLMCILALAGICMALGFLFGNVKYRNHRFIKMSSPNMNNLIICGSLCAYLTVFLLSIDTRLVTRAQFELLCFAKTWILCFGFTLSFGSLFGKTWRVHSIFTNIRRDKKAIRDSKLYLIVGGLLCVDAAMLLLWAAVSPFRMAISERGQFREQNRMVVPELERCESDHSLAFQLTFFSFKGLLMLFGCFLAWETRAVNVPALNDSKYIGISVYIVVLMCVVGLALTFILQDHLNEAYFLSTFFIIFCTSCTLCLVFLPKVVELWRTPSGAEHQRYRKNLMKSMVNRGAGGRGGSVVLDQPRGSAAGGAGMVPSCSSGGSAQQQQEGIGLHRQLSLISASELSRRSAHLEAENLRLHQMLITKSNELWDLLEKVKMISERFLESEKGDDGAANLTDELKGNLEVTGIARRRSARLLKLSTVVEHFGLRRTRTSNCL